MKFKEFEDLMHSKGISSLAEISRMLDTTPQAVSNWKSRDQVPFHIVARINNLKETQNQNNQGGHSLYSPSPVIDDSVSISDLLLVFAEQIKIILLMPIILIFLTFTYIQFIEEPEYVTWATVLVPDAKPGGSSGVSNIATQFGVNLSPGTGIQSDLSSPSLLPELLKSRTFAEKILEKKFFTYKFNEELSLLAILTNDSKFRADEKEQIITKSLSILNEIVNYENDESGNFSYIIVKTFEPQLAKELTEVVIEELESLNKFYKNQSVSKKIIFIENRILSVKDDLEISEQKLKKFNEQNRQISSPSLKLQLDRLTREMEVQKGIYLTLKQQLELAKIEEIQEASVLQILDEPHIPLGPSNKAIKIPIVLTGILGLGLGVLLAFVRSYIINNDSSEKRKLKRAKSYFRKKGKDIIQDRRIYGIMSILLIGGLPIYLGHESKNPTFFGLYSTKLMIINVLYIFTLIVSIFSFFRLSKKDSL